MILRSTSWLMSALLLGWAAPCAAGMTIPDPIEVPALEPGAQTRPVQFSRLVIKLSRGEAVGTLRGGIFCEDSEKFRWRGGQQDIDPTDFDDVFREELQKVGFSVAGDPTALFSQADDSSAEYLVGGSIRDMEVNVCNPRNILIGGDKLKGAALISVNWQIYSRLERRVVATLKTTGGYEQKKLASGTLENILFIAFAENVKRLAASNEFRDIFVGAPTNLNQPVRGPGNQKPIILAVSASKAKRSLQDAIGATVLIFAGNGYGSGFLVSTDGYVMTNEHVVGKAKYVKVRWSDGIETLGEVVRTSRPRDIAILKTDPRGRTPLRLRRDRVTVGEGALAIGAPVETKLQSSVTKGIISSLRMRDGFSFIQSDVGINPGSSGGPLIDQNSDVIGVTVSGIGETNTGLNFFIPIVDATEFLSIQLK